jgi:hypothetical protein
MTPPDLRLGMAESPEKPPLVEEVIRWLETEGYPLEFQCAAECKRQGLQAIVGCHVGREGEKLREVDVLASYHYNGGGNAFISGHLLAECKYAGGKPWVVLCQEEKTWGIDWAHKAIISEHAQWGFFTVPLTKANEPNSDPGAVARYRNLFILPTEKVGFSVLPMRAKRDKDEEKDNSDVPFKAVQKAADLAAVVASNASAVLKRFHELKPDTFVPFLSFVIPCVVIKGPIVAASYNSQSGKMECQEIGSARVQNQAGRAVYVLNTDSFPAFAERAYHHLTNFCNYAAMVKIDDLKAIRDQFRLSKQMRKLYPDAHDDEDD